MPLFLSNWTFAQPPHFAHFHPFVWGKWVNALLWRCGMGGKVTWPQLRSSAVFDMPSQRWSMVSRHSLLFFSCSCLTPNLKIVDHILIVVLGYPCYPASFNANSCQAVEGNITNGFFLADQPGSMQDPYFEEVGSGSAQRCPIEDATPTNSNPQPVCQQGLVSVYGLQVLYSCGNSSNMPVLVFVKLMQEFVSWILLKK